MAQLENRGNGNWRVTISAGYDEQGRQIRIRRTIKVDPAKTEGAQIREVERQAAKLQADHDRQLLTASASVSIAALSEEFLSMLKGRGKVAQSTLRQYRDLHEHWICPRLGKIAVQQLTPRDINAFYSKLEKTHKKGSDSLISSTFRRKIHQQLHQLCAYAVRSGYISVNPVDRVEAPGNDTGEARFLEADEIFKLLGILEALPIKWRSLFTLALFTGLRPGEIAGLNWGDIVDGVLTVSAGSFQPKGGKPQRTSKPKTKGSIRSLVLPLEALDLLEQHKADQEAFKKAFGGGFPEPDAVFTDDEGYRISTNTVSKKWLKLLRAHDMPSVPLYGLRHTAASLLIAEGMNARDVATQLGHSTPTLTLNTYSHSFRSANQRAADAAAAAIKKIREENA